MSLSIHFSALVHSPSSFSLLLLPSPSPFSFSLTLLTRSPRASLMPSLLHAEHAEYAEAEPSQSQSHRKEHLPLLRLMAYIRRIYYLMPRLPGLMPAWARLGCVGDGEGLNTRAEVLYCVRRVHGGWRESPGTVHDLHILYPLFYPLFYPLSSILYPISYILYPISYILYPLLSFSLSPPSRPILTLPPPPPPLFLLPSHPWLRPFGAFADNCKCTDSPTSSPILRLQAIAGRAYRRFSDGGRPSSI